MGPYAGAADEGVGGGAGVVAAPQSRGWGANISFPPRILEGAPRENCVENARNSITPNILLVETGQVRKNRGPSAPERGSADSVALASWFDHHQIGFPLKYTADGNRTSQKNRGPSAPKWGPPIQGPSQIGLPPPPHSKMPSAAIVPTYCICEITPVNRCSWFCNVQISQRTAETDDSTH